MLKEQPIAGLEITQAGELSLNLLLRLHKLLLQLHHCIHRSTDGKQWAFVVQAPHPITDGQTAVTYRMIKLPPGRQGVLLGCGRFSFAQACFAMFYWSLIDFRFFWARIRLQRLKLERSIKKCKQFAATLLGDQICPELAAPALEFCCIHRLGISCSINYTGLRIQHKNEIGRPFQQARYSLSLEIAQVRFRGLKSFHGNRSALSLCGAPSPDAHA